MVALSTLLDVGKLHQTAVAVATVEWVQGILSVFIGLVGLVGVVALVWDQRGEIRGSGSPERLVFPIDSGALASQATFTFPLPD